MEQEGSDLDVVVELSTNEREDTLFDMLNENRLHIGGVKVDINPITAQRTGSLETYLPLVEDYLEGMREARERDLAASISREENQKETKENLFPEQTELEVTLTVAECREFHNLGEFYENIPTVEEAVAIWKQIPPERPAARTSLKARLAEKKAFVSGQGKDHDAQENAKNNQREM